MAGKNVSPMKDEPRGTYVRWRDAYTPHQGWLDWSDEESRECREQAVCEAMGWLVEETTEGLVVSVCRGHATSDRILAPLFIPIGCIVERKDITI